MNVSNDDPLDSWNTGDFTYSLDKYSCVAAVFPLHIFFAWCAGISGLFCFITRLLPPKFKATHRYFGMGYILSMLWTTGTSIVINNTGIPSANLLGFLTLGASLTLGWIVIKFHQNKMESQALENVNSIITTEGGLPKGQSLQDAVKLEKGRIIERKTWQQRFFSYKSMHGILFTVSYFNIVGRLFASDSSDFTCHTYPAVKPIPGALEKSGLDPNMEIPDGEIVLVPTRNPNYDQLPWANNEIGWFLMLMFLPALAAIIIGIIYSCVASKQAEKASKSSTVPPQAHESDSSSDSSSTGAPESIQLNQQQQQVARV